MLEKIQGLEGHQIHCPIVKYPHVCQSAEWDKLTPIKLPEYNLGVLLRTKINFESAIQEVLASDFGYTEFRYNKNEDIRLIGAILDEDLEIKSETAFYLYDDVMTLAKEFMNLTKCSEIGIKLEVVTTDNCKFFHVDRVTYRLITTYAGSTTQWMPNEYVIRSGLGQQDNSKAVINENLYHSLPVYSVAIMKGEKLNEGSGLVHRSPPLIPDQERIILRMDVLA